MFAGMQVQMICGKKMLTSTFKKAKHLKEEKYPDQGTTYTWEYCPSLKEYMNRYATRI